MTQIENIITADEGKVFRRISSGEIYGNEISLGYTYYINGNLLTTPHKDVPEDFEEIDEDDLSTEDREKTVVPETLSDLDIAKRDIKIKITKYDSSDNVNIFYYNNIPYWLDKSTRVGLVNSTNMEKQLGYETTTLILGETIVDLPCDLVLIMLAQLEVYAKQCYNVTARHKITVNNLTTVEEVNAYDYTIGYPDKLYFNDPADTDTDTDNKNISDNTSSDNSSSDGYTLSDDAEI